MTITADLYDERGEDLGSIALPFLDLGGAIRFEGPARTVRCLEDNGLVIAAVSEPGDGRVLVIDGGGSVATALMGDVLAARALSNGWAGAVVHGAVRDRVALAQLDFGLKALATNPRRSAVDGAGEVGGTLSIAGVEVRDGAMVYCDEDGVLVERR